MKITECPRDAMQGLTEFIPTELKIKYINQLLKVGFDTIDAASFVSPKAIPQLRDSAEVLDNLDLSISKSKLLTIVANERGALEAAKFQSVSYLGFPLSLSETFQQRNTNKSIAQAFDVVKTIQEICVKHKKEMVTYISMGFGNPYNEPFETSIVSEFVDKLSQLGIPIISLSDTIGVSNKENITQIFQSVSNEYPNIEFGAHLHSDLETATDKIDAAYKAGCRRFDGAINGFGGCPMAEDKLVGNIATETILAYLDKYNIKNTIDQFQFQKAINMAPQVFLGR
jgi:hydroxymethylglutaryl-CoA lyase